MSSGHARTAKILINTTQYAQGLFRTSSTILLCPVNILHKSIAGVYWPVRVADGPITARCRFMRNASCAVTIVYKDYVRDCIVHFSDSIRGPQMFWSYCSCGRSGWSGHLRSVSPEDIFSRRSLNDMISGSQTSFWSGYWAIYFVFQGSGVTDIILVPVLFIIFFLFYLFIIILW